jgi:hypothetical protein
VHGQSVEIFTAEFNLTGVQAAAHLKVQDPRPFTNRLCAADCARRTIEGRNRTVARGLHEPASKPMDLLAHDFVVPVEQFTPSSITDCRNAVCRPDDVGEEQVLSTRSVTV